MALISNAFDGWLERKAVGDKRVTVELLQKLATRRDSDIRPWCPTALKAPAQGAESQPHTQHMSRRLFSHANPENHGGTFNIKRDGT